MSYETFKAEMTALLVTGFTYNTKQAGFSIYGEKMAALADAYPEHSDRLDSETA